MNDAEEEGGGGQESPSEGRRRKIGRPKREPVARPSKKRRLAPRPTTHASSASSMGPEQAEVLGEHQTQSPILGAQYAAPAADSAGTMSQSGMHYETRYRDQSSELNDYTGSTDFNQHRSNLGLPDGTWYSVGDYPQNQLDFSQYYVGHGSTSFITTEPGQSVQLGFSPRDIPEPKHDKERMIDMEIALPPDEGGNSESCEFDNVLVSQRCPNTVMRHDVAEALQSDILPLIRPRRVYTNKGPVIYRQYTKIVYRFPNLVDLGGQPLGWNGALALVAPEDQLGGDAPPLTIGQDWIEKNVYAEDSLFDNYQTYVAETDVENFQWPVPTPLRWRGLFFNEYQ